MHAFFPAVVALDRRWRRFVGFVADRAAPANHRSSPPARNGAPHASGGRATAAVALEPTPGRRFRGPGYRPRLGGETAGDGPNGAPAEQLADAQPQVAQTETVPASIAATPPAPAGEGEPVRPEADAPADATTAADLAANLDARRAQAAALRALLFARQRRYAEAESAFAQAAGIDRDLDLSLIDGFWELERGAHQAAVRAYESVGRHRDAMMVRATLDGRYRPRLVRTA